MAILTTAHPVFPFPRQKGLRVSHLLMYIDNTSSPGANSSICWSFFTAEEEFARGDETSTPPLYNSTWVCCTFSVSGLSKGNKERI